MEPVAIVGWSRTPMVRRTDKTEARLLFDVVTGATEQTGSITARLLVVDAVALLALTVGSVLVT